MRHCLRTALICLVILSLPALTVAETVIKFGHSGSTTHSYHIGALKFADLVSTYSKGDLKVEVFPNSQLGGEKKTRGVDPSRGGGYGSPVGRRCPFRVAARIPGARDAVPLPRQGARLKASTAS